MLILVEWQGDFTVAWQPAFYEVVLLPLLFLVLLVLALV